MRFEINFDESPGYVYIRTDGEASVRGFDKLLTEIVDSPNWKTGTKQLVDHRKLIFQKLTSSDIRKVKDIVKKNSKKLGNGRCAFVVNDTLGFGLARMYEIIGGKDIHQEVGVFYTIDEAVEWIKT